MSLLHHPLKYCLLRHLLVYHLNLVITINGTTCSYKYKRCQFRSPLVSSILFLTSLTLLIVQSPNMPLTSKTLNISWLITMPPAIISMLITANTILLKQPCFILALLMWYNVDAFSHTFLPLPLTHHHHTPLTGQVLLIILHLLFVYCLLCNFEMELIDFDASQVQLTKVHHRSDILWKKFDPVAIHWFRSSWDLLYLPQLHLLSSWVAGWTGSMYRSVSIQREKDSQEPVSNGPAVWCLQCFGHKIIKWCTVHESCKSSLYTSCSVVQNRSSQSRSKPTTSNKDGRGMM